MSVHMICNLRMYECVCVQKYFSQRETENFSIFISIFLNGMQVHIPVIKLHMVGSIKSRIKSSVFAENWKSNLSLQNIEHNFENGTLI